MNYVRMSVILQSLRQATDPTTGVILDKLQEYSHSRDKEDLESLQQVWLRAGRPRTDDYWTTLDDVILSKTPDVDKAIERLADFETNILLRILPMPAWIGPWLPVEEYNQVEAYLTDDKLSVDDVRQGINAVLALAMRRYLTST